METLAAAHARLAQVHASQGELDLAQEAYGQAFAIYTSLLQKDPRNAGWLDSLSDLHAELGWIQECRGDVQQALVHHQANLAISEDLVGQGGKRDGWQRDLAMARTDVARALLAQGQAADAMAHLERALHTLRAQVDAERPGTLLDAAGALALLAQVCAHQGDQARAAGLVQEMTDLDWRGDGVDTPSRARMLAAVQARPV